jgi:hypothetical protein
MSNSWRRCSDVPATIRHAAAMQGLALQGSVRYRCPYGPDSPVYLKSSIIEARYRPGTIVGIDRAGPAPRRRHGVLARPGTRY